MGTETTGTSSERLVERKANLEKQRKCPHCGKERDQFSMMRRFEQDIIMYLRQSRLVKRDSCIQCVEKHLGKAMVLHKELLTATETNNVNVALNHLEVVGNLQAATDEAEQWPALHDAIDAAERDYRYRGVGPDWQKLAELLRAI